MSASAMEGMVGMAPLRERYPALPVAAVMVKRPSGVQYHEFLNQHFRVLDFREFADSGHFLMMERPDQFNPILRKFLERK